MSRTQLLLGAAIALLVLLAPLIILIRIMLRPANRARLAAASWLPVVFLLLVSVSAWLWVKFSKVEIKVNISGAGELSLAVMALIGIYLVWVVTPVVAVTWTLLKLRRADVKPG